MSDADLGVGLGSTPSLRTKRIIVHAPRSAKTVGVNWAVRHLTLEGIGRHPHWTQCWLLGSEIGPWQFGPNGKYCQCQCQCTADCRLQAAEICGHVLRIMPGLTFPTSLGICTHETPLQHRNGTVEQLFFWLDCNAEAASQEMCCDL